MKEQKFKPGDRVRIVGYGHPIWQFVEGKTTTMDMSPDLVGKEGVIKGSYADFIESGDHRFRGGSRNEENQSQYHVEGIPEKCAWYDEQQLELIT